MNFSFFRSSSFNCFELCEQQFFITYILGWPSPSGAKAILGTTFHKVMECLAKVKQAQQNGLATYDDDLCGTLKVADLMSDRLWQGVLSCSFAYYTHPQRAEGLTFKKGDEKMIAGWVQDVFVKWHGLFDPRTRDIVEAEQKFNLPIEADWANYEYLDIITNKTVKCQVSLKGTIDLIVKIDHNTYEIIDWKSGRCWDWGKNKAKNFENLHHDAQLKLYHYAIHHLYPHLEHAIISINYVKEGGPFTMAYDVNEIPATVEMLHQQFDKIRETTRPQLKARNPSKHFFCTKVCHYGKTPHPDDPSKTICQYIRDETLLRGINATIKKETVAGHDLGHYHDPGT